MFNKQVKTWSNFCFIRSENTRHESCHLLLHVERPASSRMADGRPDVVVLLRSN